MNVKVTRRNINMTPTQKASYTNTRGVTRNRAPNLNFGKVAFATDADVDG